MQKNNKLAEEFKSMFPDLTEWELEEKAFQLEWFLKKAAVEAVNPENKAEFQSILQNNDLKGFVSFINKYVPDFKEKLIEFTLKN